MDKTVSTDDMLRYVHEAKHEPMTGNVGERFIDNQRIDGNLSQMINGATIVWRGGQQ